MTREISESARRRREQVEALKSYLGEEICVFYKSLEDEWIIRGELDEIYEPLSGVSLKNIQKTHDGIKFEVGQSCNFVSDADQGMIERIENHDGIIIYDSTEVASRLPEIYAKYPDHQRRCDIHADIIFEKLFGYEILRKGFAGIRAGLRDIETGDVMMLSQ